MTTNNFVKLGVWPHNVRVAATFTDEQLNVPFLEASLLFDKDAECAFIQTALSYGGTASAHIDFLGPNPEIPQAYESPIWQGSSVRSGAAVNTPAGAAGGGSDTSLKVNDGVATTSFTSQTNFDSQSLLVATMDLTPYVPSGWSDKIVVSTGTGGHSDSGPIYSDQNLYLDWAVWNNGSGNITSTFYTYLYVDGSLRISWSTNSLQSTDYAFVEDYSLGALAVGTHAIRIVTDATGVVAESNESNNEYTKTITVSPRAGADLTPYVPSGWSDKIVVSTGTGGHSDSDPIYSDQNLYLDWAVWNNGSGNVTSTFYTYLYVDGSLRTSWSTNSLQSTDYAFVNDYSLGALSVGTHAIRIVTDATGVVAESNESNNEYTKTITVSPRASVDLTPYVPSGWSDKIVVSTGTGGHSDSGPIYSDQNLYLDWAVWNNGSGNITSTFYTYLYVDGSLRISWSTNSLQSTDYAFVNDYSLGALSVGTHAIKIVTDATGVVAESNEGNNEYTKTITVSSRASADLTPYVPSGWSDKIVVSTGTGGHSDSGPIYSDQNLYLDWAVWNNGSGNVTSTFYTYLYVDGSLRTSWSTNSLQSTDYAFVNDYSLGALSVGTHAIRIVTDATGVVAESNESNNEYTKTITVSQRGGGADDHGENPGSAGTIAVGGVAYGSIETAGDNDWYGTSLLASHTYRIDLEGMPTGQGTLPDTYLRGIYNSSGQLIANSTDDDSGVGVNSEVAFTPAATGTYYVSAGAYGVNTGTYKLSITDLSVNADDHGVTQATAGSVSVNGSVLGNIETAGDNDWYGTSLLASHTYRIDLEGTPTGQGTLPDTYLRGIYNSSGQLIANSTDDDSGVGVNSEVAFTPSATGTYYISAGAYGVNTGTYKLSITDLSVNADDHGVTQATAGSVSVNGSVLGNIETAGDNDWYSVTLAAGVTYHVELEGTPTGQGTLPDTYLRGIYNSSGQLIANSTDDDSGVGVNSEVAFTPSATGTYYISAGAYGSNTGTYRLSVLAQVGSSDDFTASTGTTGRVAVGGSAFGNIETIGDEDWFSVSLLSGHTYRFDQLGSPTSSGTLADTYLRGIYTSAGNLIPATSNDDNGTVRNSQVLFTPTSTGTYYIAAGAYGSNTGTYRLDVTDTTATHPADNSFSIVVNYSGDSTYQSYFTNAALRWQQIIVADVPDVATSNFGFVDDLLIAASVTNIDGAGSILARAGADAYRDATNIPYHGIMQFDAADLAAMVHSGILQDVIIHEMGHVLGFSGYFFARDGLVSDSFSYTGTHGLAEFRALSGNTAATFVPIETGGGPGTAGGHWSEAVFDTELMTGYSENAPPMPISRVTIGALQDLGYTVNYAAADPYTLTSIIGPGPTALTAGAVEPVLSLSSLASPPVGFSGEIAILYDEKPITVTADSTSIKLDGVVTNSSGSIIYFIENATGNNYTVRIDGNFAHNSPTQASDIKGTINALTFLGASAPIATYDFSFAPLDAATALSQWKDFLLGGNNFIEVASLTPQNDVISGLAGNDILIGGLGDDILAGGIGTDILTGGSGSDNFIFSPGDGTDHVTDFSVSDKLDTRAFVSIKSFAAFLTHATQVGADVEINLATGDKLVLDNFSLANLRTENVILASGLGLSATTDNGASTLNAGHLVTLKLVGTSVYTVTGTPTLQLNDNETAIYSSGSGTNTLTFTYMVQPGDTTPDLQVTGLNLPGGASIVDATGASPSATISQDLAIRIDTSTSSATSVQQEVMGLYGALYGRAGEFPAYSFWVGYAGAGLNTGNAGSTAVTLAQATTLGQGFVNSQNTFFNQTYGALNDSQFINAMYVNIGGAAGDPNGIGYWSGLLAQAEAQGQSVQAARAGLVGQFVQVLVGFDTSHRLAGLTDQQWADALTRTETISNKIAVSLAYANASNGTGGSILIPAAVGDAAYNAAVKVLQGVTADPHTVAVALAGISNAVSHHDLSLIS